MFDFSDGGVNSSQKYFQNQQPQTYIDNWSYLQ